ncbi:MAG: hypothetical protein ACFFG0_51245 [Candidatus Thorarchaeota archaeon]
MIKMEANNLEDTIRNITKIILVNPQKMIREEDLKTLCKNFDFDLIMSEIYLKLKDIGFELIKTTFLEQTFYILTSEGKDDTVTPSQYGTLALILALSKEVDENMKIEDLKEIFHEVWDTDIKFLINNDYLRKFDEIGIIKVAPLGKAIMKNIIRDIRLKNLLDVFRE